MCSLYLSHSIKNVPSVDLGSATRIVVAPDLSCVNHPLQYYLFLLNQHCWFLSRGESVNTCCALLETFEGTTLVPYYDPCGFVDVHNRETIYSGLTKRCKSLRGRGNHAMSPVVGAPSALDVLSL